FFQAEDGIRDFHVTGVQTCALPISPWHAMYLNQAPTISCSARFPCTTWATSTSARPSRTCSRRCDRVAIACLLTRSPRSDRAAEIGRASCRERVGTWGGADCMLVTG